MAGFWKAPRALARMRADGTLSSSAYELLHFIAESGADRPDGLATSNGALADALGVRERTIRRALGRLRALELIAYDDHPGVAMFVVRTSNALAALEREPRTGPRTSGTEVMSEETSDSPASSNARKPAWQGGNRVR